MGAAAPRRGRALVAAAATALACAAPVDPQREQRIAAAARGAEDDAAIRARLAEVEAARAREAGDAPLDEFQLRVRDSSDDGDQAVRVLTRIPVPNPWEVRAERALRSAETDASVARLEETALLRGAESCTFSIGSQAHAERALLYETYAERQRQLLAWGAEWRRSGVLNEADATRFEIERRVRLAARLPDPAPIGPAGTAELPAIASPGPPLDGSAALVRELVRRQNPAVAVRVATSEGYAALSERSANTGLPWFDFVDLEYEARERQADEVGGQVAVRVPFGSTARAEAGHFEALRRAELHEAERIVEEQVRLGRQALQEIGRFEANGPRWRELLEIASGAESVADRWWRGRLADPSDVAELFDRAYDARSSVLEARARAGLAGCQLLATTGVAPEEWPRESRAPTPEAP